MIAPSRTMVQRQGFTIIEVLMVVLIISIFLGMIVFLPTSDKRHAAVRSAAEELAATLRLARSLAIERRAVVGVAFNIQNGSDTSGRIINNWGGGHWYRIIGPAENEGVDILKSISVGLPMYPHYSRAQYTPNKTGRFLRDVHAAWIGDRHVLTAKKVRFLALGDQDNGGIVSNSRVYGPTYPRPWFGYWDASTNRLFPWGGYDSAVVDGAGQSSSGFWFQGRGGSSLSDCRNPVDVIRDGATVLRQGEAHPLINGDWLDYVIRFNPDGSVCEGEVMHARKTEYAIDRNAGGLTLYMESSASIEQNARLKPGMDMITSYATHTGKWAITLAPDVGKDDDVFPSAYEAWKSLTPAYRVIVDRFGLIQVVKVRSTEPAGTQYETTPVNFQNAGSILTYYRRNVATNADGTMRGVPVSDFLTPELLAQRNWWMQRAP